MSYESKMLIKYKMPEKSHVEKALLITLFNHNGVIKEFSSDENIVEEIASTFALNEDQKNAILERIYIKENRIVKSPLWHRLLYRAADSLAKAEFITRPSKTILLTNKKEWMLTESGFDKALELLKRPLIQKETLPIKSYEVEQIVKKIRSQEKPEKYNPIEDVKKTHKISKEIKLRIRGFRQVITEVYNNKCAVCGLKIYSPKNLQWEVEAAHIVPHSFNGKDDVWNGLALCHLHHWIFDIGWFTIREDFRIIASSKIQSLPQDYGKMFDYDVIRRLTNENFMLLLPNNTNHYPHASAIKWHQKNIFFK